MLLKKTKEINRRPEMNKTNLPINNIIDNLKKEKQRLIKQLEPMLGVTDLNKFKQITRKLELIRNNLEILDPIPQSIREITADNVPF
tara:strand:+ start:774 stop:1034 length:261 start_codon:yes stop_codon:yes gene_type:complete